MTEQCSRSLSEGRELVNVGVEGSAKTVLIRGLWF